MGRVAEINSRLDVPDNFVTLGCPQNPLPRSNFPTEQVNSVKDQERRQLTRYNLRTPLRFRVLGLAADSSEHFTEALNVSRGGFFFASSAALQVGTPLEATLRMPSEVTGTTVQETRCTARVVHARNEPYSDGRIGFGAEIEILNNGRNQDRWIQ